LGDKTDSVRHNGILPSPTCYGLAINQSINPSLLSVSERTQTRNVPNKTNSKF